MINIDRPQAREADTIIAILDLMREVYEPEGCGIWLYAAHKQFGGRSPLRMIRDGEAKAVLTVITQLADGSYA